MVTQDTRQHLGIVDKTLGNHYMRSRSADGVHWFDRYSHGSLCGAIVDWSAKPVVEPITCQACCEEYWKVREAALWIIALPVASES